MPSISSLDKVARLRRVLVSLLSFSSPPSWPEVLIDHDEGVAGSGPVPEPQPAVSQAEKPDEASSSSACSSISSGRFTSMRGGGNIDLSQRNVNDTTGNQGQRPSQVEAQPEIRAYSLPISETSLA